MILRRAFVAALPVLGLLGCSTPEVPPTTSPASTAEAMSLVDTYGDLARTGGKVMRLDPAASRVRIYVFRGGAAARLGHNHVLAARRFVGFYFLPDDGAAKGRFDLEFRLDELDIDRPEDRAGLGPAFDSVPSAEAIAGTREHMLGASAMDAEHFPQVRVHSLEIIGEAPRFAARISVDMHGQVREMWVPLEVDGLPGQVRVSGSLVLKQSDFGIQPYSIGGGFLSVQDAVVVDFQLIGG